MKHFLNLLFLAFSVTAVAQPDDITRALMTTPTILVGEETVSFGTSTAPAMVVHVVAERDDFEKDWRAFVKKRGIKSRKLGAYHTAKGARVAEWSADSLSVYYEVEKEKGECRLVLLVQEKGQFMSKAGNETWGKVENDIRDQVKAFYIRYYDRKIEEMERYYGRQVKDVAAKEKKGKKLQSSLEGHRKEASKANDNARAAQRSAEQQGEKRKELERELEEQGKDDASLARDLEKEEEEVRKQQKEYDDLNKTGDLNTKKADKAVKNLNKATARAEKIRKEQAKSEAEKRKLEESIRKSDDTRADLERKVKDYERQKEKHEDGVKQAERDIDHNRKELEDEQREVEQARRDLEVLRAAKALLVS